jgi:hypothetical protein|tara:strand:+ start:797 stop:931 length:135 start_codon:yes stop_codon:yes gene_type:complete
MSKYTDEEMVIWLHDKARETKNDFYRIVADRFAELAKKQKQWQT